MKCVCCSRQYFHTVDWVTERAYHLYKNLHQLSPKLLFWNKLRMKIGGNGLNPGSRGKRPLKCPVCFCILKTQENIYACNSVSLVVVCAVHVLCFTHMCHFTGRLGSLYDQSVNQHTHTRTHVHIHLRPFFWDHPGELVPEDNFLTLWCKGRGRHTDYPAGCHSSWTNQCPPPSSPIFVQARCPSCLPTNSVKALKATSAFELGRRR